MSLLAEEPHSSISVTGDRKLHHFEWACDNLDSVEMGRWSSLIPQFDAL